MGHVKRNNIIFLFVFIVFWSLPSYAEKCMVSTDMRFFMSDHPELKTQKSIEGTGRYSVILKNGDE